MENKNCYDSEWNFQVSHETYEVFRNLEELIKDEQEYRNHFVFDILDKFITNEDSRFITTIGKGTHLYRARIINNYDPNLFKYDNNDKVCGYNEENSREAPLGRATEGRNNKTGVSYMYLSEDISTACAEVKPSPLDYISVASFELNRDINVIDFTDGILLCMDENEKYINRLEIDLEKGITEKEYSLRLLLEMIKRRYYQSVNSSNKEVYKVTQIITDYIRKAGIDGVLYCSSYNFGKKNYTIFNSHHSYFKYIKSELMCNYCQKYYFISLNGENNKYTSYTSCKDNMEMDDEIIYLHKREINDRIKKYKKKS